MINQQTIDYLESLTAFKEQIHDTTYDVSNRWSYDSVFLG